MNLDLYNYIDSLIDRGAYDLSRVNRSDRKRILSYLLLESEEPINFLVETDCHKKFMHHFINYLKPGGFGSILDSYMELEAGALDYYSEKIDEAFLEVLRDKVGAYPLDDSYHDIHVNDYSSKEGQ